MSSLTERHSLTRATENLGINASKYNKKQKTKTKPKTKQNKKTTEGLKRKKKKEKSCMHTMERYTTGLAKNLTAKSRIHNLEET